MYRLIIADDEAITLGAIQKIIERHFTESPSLKKGHAVNSPK